MDLQIQPPRSRRSEPATGYERKLATYRNRRMRPIRRPAPLSRKPLERWQLRDALEMAGEGLSDQDIAAILNVTVSNLIKSLSSCVKIW